MSNRPRKKIRRPQPRVDRDEQDARRMVRHGITPNDLEAAGKRGFDAGASAGREWMLKCSYAAAAIAYMDACAERGVPCEKAHVRALLTRMDDLICNTLTADEIIEEAWNRVGLHIEFSEAFPEDRIQENAV